MGQRKTTKATKAGQQHHHQQLAPPAAYQQLHSPGLTGFAAGAAATPAPEASVSTLQQLEEKKKRLRHQLKDVERQIYDLETRYLEGCNPNANALTGYEGLRNGVGATKPAKPATVVQEDRIFSGSSTSAPMR